MSDAAFQAAFPLARRAAEVQATAVVRTGALSFFDREDLEQEGLVAFWRALPRFDPSRASMRTFVEHVVATHIASLCRARRCRPHLQPFDNDRHRVDSVWAHEIELRSDVQQALDALPQADRQIAWALAEHTPTGVSRLLGVARSTVYVRIGRIRRALVKADLHPRRRPRPDESGP